MLAYIYKGSFVVNFILFVWLEIHDFDELVESLWYALISIVLMEFV